MIKFEDMKTKGFHCEVEQGKIIDYILKNLGNSEMSEYAKEYKDAIDGGICYMMSMEWLRLILTGDKKWQNEFGTMEHVKNNIAYYKQIANNFYIYMTEKYGMDKYLRDNRSITVGDDKEFYELGTAKKATVKENAVSADSFDELAEAMLGNEMYMSIRLFLNEGGHRVAAYRPEQNAIYFFDPNIGTILVEGKDEAELKENLKQLMNRLWNSFYTVTSSSVRFVVPL